MHKIARYRNLLSKKLFVAFRINGNLGSALLRTNFMKQMVSLVEREKIHVTVFGHFKEVINDALFQGLDFIDEIYTRKVLDRHIYSQYDFIFDLDTFPTILYQNPLTLKYKKHPYKRVFKCWKNFQKDFSCWLASVPVFRPNIYIWAKLHNKNCINTIDVYDGVKLENKFIFKLPLRLKTDEVLKKFNLRVPFITLNRGSYTKKNQSEGTRVWPLEHYNELVHLLKTRYPHFQLVQIGESAECLRIDRVDLDLCGKTSLEEIKTILATAFLHIDGEGGMSHLRKALTDAPSVVMFGSTPAHYFGHEGNINLSSEYCQESCCELHEQWLHKCMLSGADALCLRALKPSDVFQSIETYIKTGEIPPKPQTFPLGKALTTTFIKKFYSQLDEDWIQDFLSKQEIYAYYQEKIQVGDLFIQYLSSQKEWVLKPLEKSPCFSFLKKDIKHYEKYNKFKRKKTKDAFHTQQRFSDLISSLETRGFNEGKPIIVSGGNVVLDGQHRACWLLHKYGPTHQVPVIKIYGNFDRPR